MLTLGTIRLGLIVVAAVGALAGLYYLVDLIGDIREAQVEARYTRAIDNTNEATVADNDAATKVALRDQRVRDKALTDARASLTGQCPLSAAEALALARVR